MPTKADRMSAMLDDVALAYELEALDAEIVRIMRRAAAGVAREVELDALSRVATYATAALQAVRWTDA